MIGKIGIIRHLFRLDTTIGFVRYFDCAVPRDRCSKSWKTTTKNRHQYKSP